MRACIMPPMVKPERPMFPLSLRLLLQVVHAFSQKSSPEADSGQRGRSPAHTRSGELPAYTPPGYGLHTLDLRAHMFTS